MIVDGIELKINNAEFLKIIDNSHDEIVIYDNNYNVVYINKACKRHYGLEQHEMINKNFHEFIGKNYWNNSILPEVYRTQRPAATIQTTMLDVVIRTVAVPIFDRHGKLAYVTMSVRDDIQNNFFITNQNNEKLNLDNDDLLLNSEEMQNILQIVKRVSETNIICTINGERGTGKKNIAKIIHNDSSEEGNMKFHVVNAANLVTEKFDELFYGTKASTNDGLLSTFSGGTIYFEDSALMPLGVQAKLVYLIQQNQYFKIGDSTPQKLNCRLIFSTDSDLYQLTNIEKFRQDLFYLITVAEINLPPLRERKGDLKKYIFYYLNFFCKKHQVSCQLHDDTLEIMMNYSWTGNIDEIAHVIEKLVVSSTETIIKPKDLPKLFFDIKSFSTTVNQFNFKEKDYYDYMEEFEKNLIVEAYHKFKTTRAVAENLGISQTKASNAIRKYIKKEL